ncbi:MAG: DUF4143 domain-containing protein [Bacteroidota bacterium]
MYSKKQTMAHLGGESSFYFFDVWVANYLLKRKSIELGGEVFGKAFEHFLYHELYAYSHYSARNYSVSYWRTASQIEVDFVLGEHEVAIEVKGSQAVTSRHLKGLHSFAEEYPVKKLILVSNDPFPRQIGQVTALPWNRFLDQLWAGEII